MSRWNRAVAEGNLAELSQLLPHDEKIVVYDTSGTNTSGTIR